MKIKNLFNARVHKAQEHITRKKYKDKYFYLAVQENNSKIHNIHELNSVMSCDISNRYPIVYLYL